MKCPYCGKEMTQGYIQCRDGVVWTPKKSVVAALSWLQKNALILSEHHTCIAYHCPLCKKILLDYSNS